MHIHICINVHNEPLTSLFHNIIRLMIYHSYQKHAIQRISLTRKLNTPNVTIDRSTTPTISRTAVRMRCPVLEPLETRIRYIYVGFCYF